MTTTNKASDPDSEGAKSSESTPLAGASQGFPKELEAILWNDIEGDYRKGESPSVDQRIDNAIAEIVAAHERAIITELKNLSAEREPYLAHPGDLIAVEVVPLHFIENRLAQLQGGSNE